MRRTAAPTGFAFITVDQQGENAITVISGANLDVATAQVSDTDLAGCSMVAMQLEIPIAEAIDLAERARMNGVRSLVNLAPIPVSATKDALTALLEAIDFAVFNEYELALTMERLGLQAAGTHGERAADLARIFDLVVVVTLGAEGALLADAQGTVNALPSVPALVVDTTGAGDTFTGVLAVTLAEGASPVAAGQRANKAAALACQALGAQSAMPSAEQIDG
jgi:ribokinase